MKYRLLALLLALALLCGCSAKSDRNDRRHDDDDDERVEDRNDRDEKDEDEDEELDFPEWNVTEVVEIVFTPNYEGSQESAVITGYDAEGNTVWSHTTESYEVAQMTRLHPIGVWENHYYYVEDGTVVALEKNTGELLWENGDFSGSPAPNEASCMICDDGTLYLTGYFGPDFMVIDKDGNTVIRFASLDPELYWPYRLHIEYDMVVITMEGGPEGSGEYFVTLDPENWEVVK